LWTLWQEAHWKHQQEPSIEMLVDYSRDSSTELDTTKESGCLSLINITIFNLIIVERLQYGPFALSGSVTISIH
jgi:hypothetical protein